MSTNYIINYTDSSKTSFVIGPGVSDTRTDLILFGSGTVNWGEYLNEDILHLLENFANSTAPTKPIEGQLWFDNVNDDFYVYTKSGWVRSGSITIQDTPILSPSSGDLWWDSAVYSPETAEHGRNLNIYTGTGWERVVDDYLTRDGRKSMVGDIDMNGYAILNLAQPAAPISSNTPANPSQAATTQYVHDRFIDTQGDTMSGNLNLGGFRLENIGLPDSSDDAISLGYADGKYAPLISPTISDPTFTGIPVAPTAAPGTNTTQLATTAFVTTADNLKADIASPTFTGTPAAPTAVPGTNTTQLATTAFVTTADALAKVSPAFSGTPTAPTAAPGTNTTQIATTEFVKNITDALSASIAPSGSQVFTSSGTFNVPSGVTKVKVTLLGGGGGGGGGAGPTGGYPNVVAGSSGANGGTTYFGSYTAAGGAGGAGGSSTWTTPSAGGSAGSLQPSSVLIFTSEKGGTGAGGDRGWGGYGGYGGNGGDCIGYVGGAGGAALINRDTSPNNGAPGNYIAAGGGGGSGGNTYATGSSGDTYYGGAGGGGGGAGRIHIFFVTVTPNSSITVTIGSGGTGGQPGKPGGAFGVWGGVGGNGAPGKCIVEW